MGERDGGRPGRGRWLALTAALLGWMFDGLEMGLFPLVARPALRELLGGADDAVVGRWFAVATAGFLVGAATGGVLFGWLGDRFGRVRAMTLSVLTYALCSGLCGLASAPWQIAALRFVGALGMGGEWALGVALVMEWWPDRSRAWLAGVIGAAGNLGYFLVGSLTAMLGTVVGELASGLRAVGFADETVHWLTGNAGWRLLLLLGAAPAALTFLIRLFVPESERWRGEQERGATAHWSATDLVAVGLGAVAACGVIALWAVDVAWPLRLAGTLAGAVVVTAGYLYPALRYLQRSGVPDRRPILGRMALAAALSGVPLVATWGAVMWQYNWVDQLTGGTYPEAKAYTQMSSAAGAALGALLGAVLGERLGRRLVYSLLCVASLAAVVLFFRLNTAFGPWFVFWAGVVGLISASFYGWLPLYLPELFPTRLRATGQGFGFNFGRMIAAVGVLQTGNLLKFFGGDYAQACGAAGLVYLVGLGLIWFAPETRGQPLPE
jgi:MFS family permease